MKKEKEPKLGNQIKTDLPILLNYDNTRTVPSPLQCSTETPETGKIIINVDHKGKKIYCEKIKIYIPFDDKNTNGAADTIFHLDADGEISGDSNWGISKTYKRAGSTLGLNPKLDYIEFDIINHTDNSVVLNPFDITITGTVNRVAGLPKVVIRELSNNIDNGEFLKRNHAITVSKSTTPIFYLRNLMTSNPQNPLIPCTEFSADSKIQVSWDTNASSIKLYHNVDSTPFYQGSDSSTIIDKKIKKDITLLLIATLDKATLIDTIHITIASSALLANSLENSGNHLVKKNLNVNKKTTANKMVINDALTVSGMTTFKSHLHIQGDLKVD
ncbi:hypothetical protein ACDQ55_19775 [Chitinophaga sp. 30R24]|uniref:hypothetical protein n=1 Tax=Chitinophaga sp. 30R24 TaxID=3248838 RepID=UPI003B8F28B6